ncbi:collagen alpha-1(XII) chain-like [Ylistrum balloti]|uniref:collagen alpha-1(XII) chain-like n=1 Tax=Ylistrum balloti TaxID=509963 RepID=UPI002905C758|nr:collagen alpha-1(XII) chain-like [Ylistrum balloti]
MKCYVDIAFVVDSSSSIPEKDFKIMKKFMEELVKRFEVGPKDALFAAVSFSDGVKEEFKFSDSADQATVIDNLEKIRYKAGLATKTYAGIRYMNENLFGPDNGARNDAVHVGIIMTDGTTNPGSDGTFTAKTAKAETQKEAKAAKDNGIFLFAVGIGSKVDDAELSGIANAPSSTYMFKVKNFEELKTEKVKKELANSACHPVKAPNPTPIPGPAPEIPQAEDPKEVCQGKKADVIFLLDESSSIHTTENFKLELSFVKAVIDYLDVSNDLTRVGLITFSSEANMRFQLDKFTTKDELHEEVDKINWRGGDTYIDKALDLLMGEGFELQNGAREDAAQIAIIITDGNSTNLHKTKIQAEKVHKKGIYVFAIGVGFVNRDELNILASDPNSDYVFTVNDLKALNTIKKILVYKVCKEKPQNALQKRGKTLDGHHKSKSVEEEVVSEARIQEIMKLIDILKRAETDN